MGEAGGLTVSGPRRRLGTARSGPRLVRDANVPTHDSLRPLFCLFILLLSAAAACAQEPAELKLEYAPAPVDNPLKGLVPYKGKRVDRFPHSMEFSYLPLSELVVGPEKYNWSPLERLLDEVAGRGHQAVFRVFLEYPGKTGCIPAYLIQQGLKVHKYENTNTQPEPPAPVETPDYEDPRLRQMLREFIAALGKKYDGDPRVGYIEAGLLGTWGEWHTYPRDELFASKAAQTEVLDAYEAAFRSTPILVRYPAGPGHETLAPNAHRRLGYHDDSFAWATLRTNRPEDDWFFLAAMQRAGPQAMEKWKSSPIGGEIRPEAWGKVFDDPPGLAEIQDFSACVAQTHATWLMDSGLFLGEPVPQRRARAEERVRRMGYEFHVPSASLGPVQNGKLPVTVRIENRGVAPFYVPWTAELGLIVRGKVVRSAPITGKLAGLLPGEPARVWRESLDVAGLKPGRCHVAIRVANPLPKGHPVRFANRSQDQDLPGWVTLGEVDLR